MTRNLPRIACEDLTQQLAQLTRTGAVLLGSPYSPRQLAELGATLAELFSNSTDDVALKTRDGAMYGGRLPLKPLLAAWPEWRNTAVTALLNAVLGENCGLVRALYFDKPPGASWSLAWHRDLTIAVREHRAELGPFRRPTVKAGVPHVIAPRELLDRMLTLRIHLDAATADNGALQVIPGSHATDDEAPVEAEGALVLAEAGDVLAMRPRILHGSDASSATCTAHRRILHLEFAADRELPAGYAWHDFEPVA